MPIWEKLQQEAQALQPQLLPKSRLGKAVNYLLNEYTALTGYLQSGTYEIDNNLVENSIRVPAVGRRRWLFIGHPDAGWRSAVIYSLIVSCRRRGINPQDIPDRCPAAAAGDEHHPDWRTPARQLETRHALAGLSSPTPTRRGAPRGRRPNGRPLWTQAYRTCEPSVRCSSLDAYHRVEEAACARAWRSTRT